MLHIHRADHATTLTNPLDERLAAETAESTLVATHLPDRLRGSGFGLLGGLQAAGGLAASVIAGLIWSIAGSEAAFLGAAAWMLGSPFASALIARPNPSA
jgi:hypothetical protein